MRELGTIGHYCLLISYGLIVIGIVLCIDIMWPHSDWDSLASTLYWYPAPCMAEAKVEKRVDDVLLFCFCCVHTDTSIHGRVWCEWCIHGSVFVYMLSHKSVYHRDIGSVFVYILSHKSVIIETLANHLSKLSFITEKNSSYMYIIGINIGLYFLYISPLFCWFLGMVKLCIPFPLACLGW